MEKQWIEIKGAYHRLFIQHKSLSSRRAWIEIFMFLSVIFFAALSLSSRRAWIEIYDDNWYLGRYISRSPRGERGLKCQIKCNRLEKKSVALLAESVD